jgi:hypothetical protein
MDWSDSFAICQSNKEPSVVVVGGTWEVIDPEGYAEAQLFLCMEKSNHRLS